MKMFWWRGEDSAYDNTVRIGMLEHSFGWLVVLGLTAL